MPTGLIVDRSNNNAGPVNWERAKEGGVIAVILKATEGETFTDDTYAPQLAGALAVGLPVLAYHFAHFTDAAKEAAKFVSVAGARARILDSETNANVAWQNAFLAALNEPADELMDYGSASSLPRSGIRSLLWPASYGKNYGFGDCWQFTDAQVVPGMPGKVDASRWVGSDADFDALFNITPAVPTTNQGDDSMFGDLANSKQDNFDATFRFIWLQLRKDVPTGADFAAYWYTFNLPSAQKGFGGSIDLVVAQIHDSAGTNLR
jgi:hypothetical protein